MATKKQVNVRLGPFTEGQITWLAERWRLTKSEVLRICVDRVHEHERRMEAGDRWEGRDS